MTTYTPATPAQMVTQLENARALLAHAWVQGRYRMPLLGILGGEDCGYAYCIGGALEWSVLPHEFEADYPLRDALTPTSNLLREAIGLPSFEEADKGISPFKDLINWNDAPGRTQAEVVAAVDKAIEIARQRANTEVPHERHATQ